MTRSPLYRCPKCGKTYIAMMVSNALRIELDARVQRLVCPVEGADLRQVVAVKT